MDFEWDDAKDRVNRDKHGIGFDAVVGFDWDMAKILDRTRHEDGEPRFAAIGMFRGRLFTVIYTWRNGTRRIISFRRSNTSEETAYGQD
jgi:uncharacterized DUF497 family protein